jgi:acyl-CoA thioester hydrolase
MDAFGHVNNAMYFSYFEPVRVDWLSGLGVGHELVLANVSCTFFTPLTFPVDIEVRLYAGRAGRSSLDTYYTIRTENGKNDLCSIGHGTIVWFDHAAGHSVRIPEPVSRQLNHGD